MKRTWMEKKYPVVVIATNQASCIETALEILPISNLNLK